MYLATNFMRKLRKNGVIEKYNNNSVYKRVKSVDYQEPKAQPITIPKEIPIQTRTEIPARIDSRQHYEFSKHFYS